MPAESFFSHRVRSSRAGAGGVLVSRPGGGQVTGPAPGRREARDRTGSGPVVMVVTGPAPRAALELRRAVFVEEQGIPAELEDDGQDADADHAIVLDEAGEAVAAARLLDPGGREADGSDGSGGPAGLGGSGRSGGAGREPYGVVGRVAVRRARRGNGLGRLVTEALERRARDRGLTAIELHAQRSVEEFYRRAGYLPRPERYGVVRDVVAGIDHVWMRRELVPGLRPVRDDDGPALERLIRAVWSEYPGCVLDVDAEEPWLRAPASAYAGGAVPAGRAARHAAMWVATAPEGEIIASVGVRLTAAPGGAAEIKSLYVAAAARRRGIARALVRRAERHARSHGARAVELWTDSRFLDAHRLYARLGYTRTGRERDLPDLSRSTEYEYHRDLPARGPLAPSLSPS